jgi:hypothetical protein
VIAYQHGTLEKNADDPRLPTQKLEHLQFALFLVIDVRTRFCALFHNISMGKLYHAVTWSTILWWQEFIIVS